MKAQILRYAARFDALSVRERVLVFGAAVAVIGFILFSALLDPAARERAQLQDRIGKQSQALASTRAAVQTMRQSQADPDATTRARREHATRELAALESDLAGAARGLVPPERMAELLDSLVARSRGLRLVALRSLPASPLVDTPPAKPEVKATASKDDAPGIFKHGIELTVQGSYGDLTAYVAKLETMPVRMYWARAALDANAYPRVDLTLTLFTLSLDRSWLRL